MSMSKKERGILIGLAIVLAAGSAFIVIKAAEQRRGGSGGAADAGEGATFNTGRLPDVGKPIREEKTPGGVTIQVIKAGKGAPVSKGQAIDVDYRGYSALSGSMFERGTYRGLVLGKSSVIQGWTEGLAGIRPREKRRLLIPSKLAYGARGSGKIAPNSDLIFDVEWVRLEIDDLKVGTGKEARRGQKVLVHYKGTLENGHVFDSSYKHTPPEPIWLDLKYPGGVIEGWALGIPGMKVGGRRKLWIPWKLAYGDQAQKGIPAYANLEFVVELLDVK